MKLSATFHKDFKLNGRSFQNDQELIKASLVLNPELAEFLRVWFNDVPYIDLRTSGATGEPKLISLKKRHMVNSARATSQFFSLPAKTTALHCLPNTFIAGKMMLVRALTLGWHLTIIEPSSRPLLGSLKNYDFCAMIPWQLANSLGQLDQIKKLIIGGAEVPKDILKELTKCSSQIYATYGMTETCTHIALKPLNNKAGLKTHKPEPYTCLPKIKISTDSRGCLLIEAPEISDAIIMTNDLVKLEAKNKFTWLGRFDNIINSGAVKLIPEKIESSLSAIISSRFFVAGIPDKMLGEKLILVIESQQDDPEILDKIKKIKGLDPFETPKEVYYLEKFIETGTKKIQRTETLDLIL